MLTLSYGYKKPQNPDTGDQWFPAMEANIQLMNDHVHDGTFGKILPTKTQSLPAAGQTTQADGSSNTAWTAAPQGAGIYRMTVTMPTGYSYDSVEVGFRLSNGTKIFPSVEKITSSTFYVYINDNTQTITAVYSS